MKKLKAAFALLTSDRYFLATIKDVPAEEGTEVVLRGHLDALNDAPIIVAAEFIRDQLESEMNEEALEDEESVAEPKGAAV